MSELPRLHPRSEENQMHRDQGFRLGILTAVDVLGAQRIEALSQRHAMGVGELDRAIKELRGMLG
jgi:hypothetical protein